MPGHQILDGLDGGCSAAIGFFSFTNDAQPVWVKSPKVLLTLLRRAAEG
jgi:porphobilinogen deaminase